MQFVRSIQRFIVQNSNHFTLLPYTSYKSLEIGDEKSTHHSFGNFLASIELYLLEIFSTEHQ